MNPYPSPLLCLYCDKTILPGNYEGAKYHMFRCEKHPARPLIRVLVSISNRHALNPDPVDRDEIIQRIDSVIPEDVFR